MRIKLIVLLSWTLFVIPGISERTVIKQEGFTSYDNCQTAGNQLLKLSMFNSLYHTFACIEVK